MMLLQSQLNSCENLSLIERTYKTFTGQTVFHNVLSLFSLHRRFTDIFRGLALDIHKTTEDFSTQKMHSFNTNVQRSVFMYTVSTDLNIHGKESIIVRCGQIFLLTI